MKSKILVLMIILTMVLGVSGLGSSQIAKANTISILALDTSIFDTEVLDALTGTTFTKVSPTAFATIDLSAYNVLYVGSAFQDSAVTIPSQAALDALNARKSDIAEFIQAGHGIVALSEPIGTGRYTWLPFPVTASKLGGNEIKIVEPGHPVMDGLTDAGLSNWNASYHNIFTDTGSLTILALGSGLESRPTTLAGTFGSGKIVLTGQDLDFHYKYGQLGQQVEFLQNAIDWVAQPLVISATIDIDPDTLNLKSKGSFTAYITLPDGYSVADIDLDTVVCEGAQATRGSIEGDRLIAKFNRQELLDVEPGDEVEMTVIGKVAGILFEGSDTIRVIDKGKN
ncbi:hypothetical protein ACFLWI_02785 [Chloroflexota bacterium]